MFLRKYSTCERYRFVLQDTSITTCIEPSFMDTKVADSMSGNATSYHNWFRVLPWRLWSKFRRVFCWFSPYLSMTITGLSLDVRLVWEHDRHPIFKTSSLRAFCRTPDVVECFSKAAVAFSLWVALYPLFFEPVSDCLTTCIDVPLVRAPQLFVYCWLCTIVLAYGLFLQSRFVLDQALVYLGGDGAHFDSCKGWMMDLPFVRNISAWLTNFK